VAQGVLGRLRPRIFLTFGTTRVVGRQPYAPAAFTPGEISGTHFQSTWFRRGEPRKKSPVTPPGIDPGTIRLVAQRLNHYATPGQYIYMYIYMCVCVCVCVCVSFILKIKSRSVYETVIFCHYIFVIYLFIYIPISIDKFV